MNGSRPFAGAKRLQEGRRGDGLRSELALRRSRLGEDQPREVYCLSQYRLVERMNPLFPADTQFMGSSLHESWAVQGFQPTCVVSDFL